MALIEPANPTKPHNPKMYTGEHYESAINQSIQRLLDSLQNPNPNFSVFTPTFLELMQVKPYPPLDTIWVLSSLTYHTSNSPNDDLLDQISAVKALFQSTTASSASCSSSVCIASIAPIIFKLYRIAVDLKSRDVVSKREKKLKREIMSFLDEILGYFGLCCSEEQNGENDSGFVRPLNDLVSIWVRGEGTGDEAGKTGSRLFFPLLSDEIVDWVNEESGDATGVLAGAVILETFLLKLCLKFSEGRSRDELKNELRTWVVCSVTWFCSFYFFDMLVTTLLEPTLTLTSTPLLGSEDESFLRKTLYDVVILADYSFLRPEKMGRLPKTHVKKHVLARLMMTHEAVDFSRKNGDHAKAIAYTNAFAGSYLPAVLVQLVTGELGVGRSSRPNGSSPTAFLRWVLDVEDRGVRLSDDFVSKHHARLAGSLNSDLDRSFSKTDKDPLFFIDNKGHPDSDSEENTANAAFLAAARAMQSETNANGKKRRETDGDEKKRTRVKFQRVDVSDEDGSVSASEVEDPGSSDEDSD